MLGGEVVATTDLLTMPEARRAVNLPDPESGNSMDIELQLFVSGISDRIDELCGPVVQRTISSELHDGGVAKILLNKQWVSSVTTATEYVSTTGTTLTAESNSSKPSSAYLLESVGPYSWLRRRSSGGDTLYASGRGNIDVTYVAGRVASTAAVTEQFKLAASAVLRRLWKREGSSWSQQPSFFPDTENPTPTLQFYRAVDPMVKELLCGQILPPVGI